MASLWEEVLAAARKAWDVGGRGPSAGAVSWSDCLLDCHMVPSSPRRPSSPYHRKFYI